MDLLDSDLIKEIHKYLPLKSMLSFEITCRTIKNVVRDKNILQLKIISKQLDSLKDECRTNIIEDIDLIEDKEFGSFCETFDMCEEKTKLARKLLKNNEYDFKFHNIISGVAFFKSLGIPSFRSFVRDQLILSR